MLIHFVHIPDAMFFELRFGNSFDVVCGRAETMFSKCIACKFMKYRVTNDILGYECSDGGFFVVEDDFIWQMLF